MSDLDLDAIQAWVTKPTNSQWQRIGFIASARTDVPVLVDEVKRLRRIERAAQDIYEAAKEIHYPGDLQPLTQALYALLEENEEA